MTPRERVEAVLYGGEPDHVPFTSYQGFVPQCEVERKLRNEDLCILKSSETGYHTFTPNCATERLNYTNSVGRGMVRTTIYTPAGDLSSLVELVPPTGWCHEAFFKDEGDYDKLIALANDTQHEARYEVYHHNRAWLGEDFILVPHLNFSPLQEILYSYMNAEIFSIEWAERRDRVLELWEALANRDRRLFPIIANHPCGYARYCGNVSPQIIGRERFIKYILPMYHEFGAMMHEHGKLMGVHLDADCGPYADLIAASEIDVIEAFTPAPDTDMSIAQARAAWPEKILWANFPSSVHLSSDEVVYETACRMIDEDGGAKKLIITITEDVPPYRWQDTFQQIARACKEYGKY